MIYESRSDLKEGYTSTLIDYAFCIPPTMKAYHVITSVIPLGTCFDGE
jgi:hypothetical protein